MNTSSHKELKKVISINPYFCFAACLEIVMDNKTGKSLDQDTITNFLGVTIPYDDIHLFSNTKVDNIKISNVKEEWGVDVDTNNINSLFLDNDIALKCEFKSIYIYEEWGFEEEMISLNSQGPIILGFDYHSLFKKEDNTIIGHAVVGLESFSVGKKAFVRAYDPGPAEAGFKDIDLEDIFVAAKRKGGGIWTFASTNK